MHLNEWLFFVDNPNGKDNTGLKIEWKEECTRYALCAQCMHFGCVWWVVWSGYVKCKRLVQTNQLRCAFYLCQDKFNDIESFLRVLINLSPKSHDIPHFQFKRLYYIYNWSVLPMDSILNVSIFHEMCQQKSPISKFTSKFGEFQPIVFVIQFWHCLQTLQLVATIPNTTCVKTHIIVLSFSLTALSPTHPQQNTTFQ